MAFPSALTEESSAAPVPRGPWNGSNGVDLIAGRGPQPIQNPLTMAPGSRRDRLHSGNQSLTMTLSFYSRESVKRASPKREALDESKDQPRIADDGPLRDVTSAWSAG